MATTALPLTDPIPPNPASLHTNDSLNLSVLRRHNPEIVDILSIAPFAVIYTFNMTLQTWEKSGAEGTLFVCRLTSIPTAYDVQVERYAVVVLNRRGLENFELELTSEEDVEITPEYVILQAEKKRKRGEDVDDVGDVEPGRIVYGLWIFAEPAPGSTAMMREVHALLILELTKRAEASRRKATAAGQRYVQERESGDQRTYRNAGPPPIEVTSGMNGGGGDLLGDLFRRARQGYNG